MRREATIRTVNAGVVLLEWRSVCCRGVPPRPTSVGMCPSHVGEPNLRVPYLAVMNGSRCDDKPRSAWGTGTAVRNRSTQSCLQLDRAGCRLQWHLAPQAHAAGKTSCKWIRLPKDTPSGHAVLQELLIHADYAVHCIALVAYKAASCSRAGPDVHARIDGLTGEPKVMATAGHSKVVKLLRTAQSERLT